MSTPTDALVHDPLGTEAVQLSPSQLSAHTLRPSNLGPIVFTLRECFMQESSVVSTVRSPELQMRSSQRFSPHFNRTVHKNGCSNVTAFISPFVTSSALLQLQKQIQVVSDFFFLNSFSDNMGKQRLNVSQVFAAPKFNLHRCH